MPRRSEALQVDDPLSWLEAELPQLATPKQVVKAANLSRSTIARALARGDLPCVRIGRAVRIRRDAVKAWLTRGLEG